MVRTVFRVIFSGFARRRMRQIHDFEENVNDKRRASTIGSEILKQAAELQKLPDANPNYLDADDTDIRYRKAFSYKIIFRVLRKTGEVLILTVRNDAENPSKIKEEL